MKNKVKIFGAALDVIPSPERIGLKLAYINHQENEPPVYNGFKDPYDFIKTNMEKNRIHNNGIEWAGGMLFPSWLTPKPMLRDKLKLTSRNMGKFLKNNGCWRWALSVANYIKKEIYPNMPVMIGVDHSLTGGSIMALGDKNPNLNVVILDAHFDVMNNKGVYKQDYPGRRAVFSSPYDKQLESENPLNYYGCGNFLDHLLKKNVISPKNLWIVGVQDEIYRELKGGSFRGGFGLNTTSIKEWMEAGVHVIFKHEARSSNFEIHLNGPTYLSIDMDVGSMSSIYSARFMNSYGLNTTDFLHLLHRVSRSIRSSHFPLVGLDMMEFDVHFFEAIKEKKIDDGTEEIVKEIFKLFIDRKRCKYVS